MQQTYQELVGCCGGKSDHCGLKNVLTEINKKYWLLLIILAGNHYVQTSQNRFTLINAFSPFR